MLGQGLRGPLTYARCVSESRSGLKKYAELLTAEWAIGHKESWVCASQPSQHQDELPGRIFKQRVQEYVVRNWGIDEYGCWLGF